MNQTNIDLNIRAFSKLYQYCADRRHHLVHKTERGNDDIWERAETINENIKKQYDIDAFNIDDRSQYLNYEVALGKYILNFNHKHILKGRDISDEVSLILGAKDYPIEKFKNKNLDDIKDFIFSNDIKLSANKIKTLIQNTVKVNVYQEKESDVENYFITSKINYKNLDRIVLIHAKGAELTENVLTQEHFYRHLGMVTNIVKKHPSKISIASIMMTKKNSMYHNLANKPVRLFMALLDRYGVDIETEKGKRRFHKNLNSDTNLPLKKYYTNTLFEFQGDLSFRQIQDEAFRNFYALDLKRHAHDISKGRI